MLHGANLRPALCTAFLAARQFLILSLDKKKVCLYIANRVSDNVRYLNGL